MKRILDGMMATMQRVKPPRMTALRDLHDAHTGPFSILIGTILSARTRDESTTKVVKELFARYKTPRELARARHRDVERIVKPIGFYRVKSRRIMEVARIIDTKYGGRVPDDLETLVGLPGVGRKTANCVLVYAFEKPAIPVDIHVHRISNRLGLVDTRTPEETEAALTKKVPKRHWLHVNDIFVMYGQNICKPVSPMCEVCGIRSLCKYYANSASLSKRESRRPAQPRQRRKTERKTAGSARGPRKGTRRSGRPSSRRAGPSSPAARKKSRTRSQSP
ncbi:EndoIII-related endonuclease [Cenarchaeum symbiosum A]|uniref:Endonuclease III n=1 Tax=Cenarchaeum symbiosum (strain A) TaxID=414004 RepID=A0RYU8_CENSY|nr:EndoIII-related endonuclease [Cenarchaeum symbiosum A]